MSVNRYKPSLTDEALQSPPKSVKEKGNPSEIHPANNVLLTVERNEGCCPYVLEGDEILHIGMLADKLDYICPFAQYEYYPYIAGMTFGISAVDLGISCGGEDGFVHCGAWGCPTCEAKVVFRLHPIPAENPMLDDFYEYLARENHHCTPEPMREKYSDESTIQQREDLMEEWDTAGRPLFWDKWGESSKLKQKQIENRKKGIAAADAMKAILERNRGDL